MLKYRKRTITFTALTLKRSVKQLIKLVRSWFRLDNLCYVLFAGISFAKNKTIVKPSVSLQLGCGDLTSLLLQQSYCTIFLGDTLYLAQCAISLSSVKIIAIFPQYSPKNKSRLPDPKLIA